MKLNDHIHYTNLHYANQAFKVLEILYVTKQKVKETDNVASSYYVPFLTCIQVQHEHII